MEAVANLSTPCYCFSEGSKLRVATRLSSNYIGFVMLPIMRFHVWYSCGVWLMGG